MSAALPAYVPPGPSALTVVVTAVAVALISLAVLLAAPTSPALDGDPSTSVDVNPINLQTEETR